jgi:hypothetical protein
MNVRPGFQAPGWGVPLAKAVEGAGSLQGPGCDADGVATNGRADVGRTCVSTQGIRSVGSVAATGVNTTKGKGNGAPSGGTQEAG